MEAIATSAIPPDFESFVIFIRIAERILLTLFFVVVATVIMIVYRKKIQNIDLNLANEAGSVKTTTSLIMPVFILLTIILFTYVVLMSPVSLESSRVARDALAEEPIEVSDNARKEDGSVVVARKNVLFVGYGADPQSEQRLARDLLGVIAASSNLRLATNALPDDQREAITSDIDSLGQSATGLQAMLFGILNDRFPGKENCFPNVLTKFQPSPDEGCHELNAFLFRE